MSREVPARLSWWTEWGLAIRILWAPLLPGMLIVVGAYTLWLNAERAQERTREAVVASEAGRVREELLRALDLRAARLQQFVLAHPPAAADTAGLELAFTRARLPFRAIVTLDSTLAVRRVLPPSARVTSAAAAADDESRALALHAITDSPGLEAALVTTAPLASAGRQLLTCAAIVPGQRRGGFVVAIERERDVLDETLGRSVRDGFSAGVFEGQELVFGSRLVDGGGGADIAREDVTTRDAVMWRIQLWPAEELFRSYDAHAPLWLLGLGTALAFFVSLCVYLWREGTDGADSEPESGADPGAGPRAVVEDAALEDPARSAE